MLDLLFNSLIKRPLFSGIYTETWENLADGGITCFQELSIQFRTVIAIIMVILAFLSRLLKNIFRQFFNFASWDSRLQRSGKNMASTLFKKSCLIESRVEKICEEDKPHFAEIVMGYVSILIFLIQAVYKFHAGKGIFLLNPCHIVLVSSFIPPRSEVFSWWKLMCYLKQNQKKLKSCILVLFPYYSVLGVGFSLQWTLGYTLLLKEKCIGLNIMFQLLSLH